MATFSKRSILLLQCCRGITHNSHWWRGAAQDAAPLPAVAHGYLILQTIAVLHHLV